jgi:hypothetical protein
VSIDDHRPGRCATPRFFLRARAADSAWLYYSAVGPCVTRSHAVEFDGGDIEQRCANATELFGMTFNAVEASGDLSDSDDARAGTPLPS